MTPVFAINTRNAIPVVDRLKRVSRNINGMGRVFDEYDRFTGSGRINEALDTFFKDSSDHRKEVTRLLDGTAKVLGGVATGATRTDGGLAEGLEGRRQPRGEQPEGVRA